MTKIKILPNGMAQAVNEYNDKPKTSEYYNLFLAFDKANPPLPYIGTATVGDVIDGRLVWQFNYGKWDIVGDCYIENGKPTSFVTDDYETRQAWLIVEAKPNVHVFTYDLSAYQFFRTNAGDKFDGNVYYNGTIDDVVKLMEDYAKEQKAKPPYTCPNIPHECSYPKCHCSWQMSTQPEATPVMYILGDKKDPIITTVWKSGYTIKRSDTFNLTYLNDFKEPVKNKVLISVDKSVNDSTATIHKQ